MMEIPLQWRAYAARQGELGNRTSVDAVSWGAEATLNFLLDGNLAVDAGTANRVAAAGARRSRYSRALLARVSVFGEDRHVESGRVDAQLDLADLRRGMSTDQLELLIDLAVGVDPIEIARTRCTSVGAVRARACRARQVARDIAA